MPMLGETLNAFNAYFTDKLEVNAFIASMKDYDNDRNMLSRDFYTKTIDTHDEVNKPIKRLIKNALGDKHNSHGRYLNQHITIYDFLVELKESVTDTVKKTKLQQFIQQLDAQKNTRWYYILLGSLGLSAGLMAPFFAFGLTVLQQVLSVNAIIAGGGLIYASAIGIQTLYEHLTNENKSESYYQQFKDNFFALSNIVLNITAWSLMITAAVTTPVISLVFIAADAVLIIKELVSLGYIYLSENPGIQPDSSFIDQQKQARELSDFETRRHNVWVNLAAAILMTAIIAAWCFAPGGIFVVAGVSLAAIGAVYLIKTYAIHENKVRMQGVLRARFTEIELAEESNKFQTASSLQQCVKSNDTTDLDSTEIIKLHLATDNDIKQQPSGQECQPAIIVPSIFKKGKQVLNNTVEDISPTESVSIRA